MGSNQSRERLDRSIPFACNDEDAETALPDPSPDAGIKTVGAKVNPLPRLTAQSLRWTQKEANPTQFRQDAKIWQLYLEEAEEKAQDKAELWKTGLDSLLIYAGLFAGVVSSFVIDIRSDLQPDREPRLLSDILDFLRNASASNTSGIGSTAYWIHGLWVVSLFTTIFSAIMGVLAKAWLAKYTPAKNRGKATDAYHRYKLDRQSERWYLKEVLILAPLFVQIASVLFLSGLILQSLGDNPTIGRVLLALCVAGGLAYFSVTFFPLFVPSSPFNTPLSELLYALYSRNSDGEDRSAFKPDIDDGLGEILYYKLIMSGKSPLIDGAVAEIALPSFWHEWTNFLCKNDTPSIVFSRFEECAASRATDVVQRNEVLGNHLLALLSFAELYQKNLKMANPELRAAFRTDTAKLTGASKATLDDLGSYINLDKALRDALEHGRPLHSWNDLPDAVRPLLFALRANVLLIVPMSVRYMVTTRSTQSDFSQSELVDRPWEMAFQDILPGHRIHFMLAACCGLVEGKEILSKISSFILCLSIAKAAFTASETGRTSEWASSLTEDQRNGVDTLTLRYMSHLYKATVLGWEAMTGDALQDISSIEPVATGDVDGKRREGTVLRIPRLLLLSLSQPNHAMRAHAFKMLTHWICTTRRGSNHAANFLQSIGKHELRCIADITIFDDRGMQGKGLTLLLKLMGEANEDKVVEIKDILVASIRSGLGKYEDPMAQIATMHFIEKLSLAASRSQNVISVVSDALPALDDLFRALSAQSVKRATGSLFRSLRLGDDATFKLGQALKAGSLDHLTRSFDSHHIRTDEILRELITALQNGSFGLDEERPPWTFPWKDPQELIGGSPVLFGKLVEAATAGASKGARKVLELLSRSIAYKPVTQVDALSWLKPITSPSNSWAQVRHSSVSTVAVFSKRVDVSSALLNLLAKTALTDDDSDVRFASLDLATKLSKDHKVAPEIMESVKQSVLDSVREEEDFDQFWEYREQQGWVLFLHEIAKRVPFPEAITIIIRFAMNGMARSNDSDSISRAAVVLGSDEFAQDPNNFQVLKECTPPELDTVLSKPGPQSLSRAVGWVRLLVSLLPRAELHTAAMGALREIVDPIKGVVYGPATGEDTARFEELDVFTRESAGILSLLSDCEYRERVQWTEIFSMICGIFPQDFQDAPNLLIEVMLHFEESAIQSIVLQSLLSLGNHGGEPRSGGLATLTNMGFEDEDYDVRSEVIKLLSDLSSGGGGQSLFQPTLDQNDIPEMCLRLFDRGIKDIDPLPRQCWLKFVIPHIKDASSARFITIFDAAIKDSDSSVRREASSTLHRLLDDIKLRDSFASKLGKSIASALKSKDHSVPAICLLVSLTSNIPNDALSKGDDLHPPQTTNRDYRPYPLGGLNGALLGEHDAWVRLVMLLGRYDFQGVPKLVETAIKDEGGRNFRDLNAAFEKVKLLEQIQADLPSYLDRALSETKSNARLEAVNLLSSLLCAESGDSLLGASSDSHLMSRLAEISVKDDDPRLKESASKLLKSLLTNSRFRESIGSSWCKPIEACLGGQESGKHRMNAISILSELTETTFLNPTIPVHPRSIDTSEKDSPRRPSSAGSPPGSSSPAPENTSLRTPSRSRRFLQAELNRGGREYAELDKVYAALDRIILPSIPILLRLTLLVSDRGHENLRKVAEDILLQKLKVYRGGLHLNEEVLSTIPSMVPAITAEGKRIALHIVETLPVSDDKALAVAHALGSLLRNPSSFSRAVSVELLSGLYRKYRLSKPRLIESSIQEVIALALDEKDDVGETRRTAIQLLSALSEPLSAADGPHPGNTPLVRPTVHLATQFMGLLQNEDLRPSVVELLSLMATQVSVRSAISVKIMASSLKPDDILLQGHTELFARLISDGRFEDEAADKVMILLASTLVTRPTLGRYRFEVLTALWCRYGATSFAPYRATPPDENTDKAAASKELHLKPADSSTQQLVRWVNIAIFGRHASLYEVEKYLTRSSLWLPKLAADSAEFIEAVSQPVVEEPRREEEKRASITTGTSPLATGAGG